MNRSSLKILCTSSLVAAFAFGCPEPDPQQAEPREIDHAEVKQSVMLSITASLDSIAEAVLLLEGSSFFGMAEDYYYHGGGEPYESCYWMETPDGDESMVCETYEPGRVDMDIEDARAAILEFLEERIFIESNIESETGTSVIYLLGGDVLCEEDNFYEPEEYTECLQVSAAAEIRLRARSLAVNSVDIDVLVGPQMFNPVSFGFAPNRVRVIADLGAIKSSVEFIDDLVEGETMLPDVFKGRVEATYQRQNDELSVSLAIRQALDVQFDDFRLKLGTTTEAYSISADLAAKTLRMALGLNAIETQFSTEIGGHWEYEDGGDRDFGDDDDYDWDDDYYWGGGHYVEGEIADVRINLAGLKGVATLFDNDDRVEIRGASLGNGASRVHINNKEVLSIDLNANHGRAFDLDVFNNADDELELSFGPAFDLQLALAFHRVADLLSDFEPFLLDDVMRITLDGAQNPALAFGGYQGVKVLRGKLTFRSQAAGITAEVGAGMCVGDAYYLDDVSHPFEFIVAETCEVYDWGYDDYDHPDDDGDW